MRPHSDYNQPFAAALRLMDEGEVFELAEQIEDLRTQPGWKRIIEMLGRGREGIMHALVNGETLEQAEYARLVGFAAGIEQLTTATETITAAAARLRDQIAADAARPEDEIELAPDGLTPAT